MNLNAIKTLGSRVLFALEKYSPEIAFGVGVIGFGVTVYCASKAGSRVEDIKAEAEENMEKVKAFAEINEEYAETDMGKDKTAIMLYTGREYLKLFAPTFACSVVSLSGFLCSYRILSTRNAALITAYATLEQGFRSYRSKVADKIGKEKERNLYYGFEEKTETVTKKTKDGKEKKVKKKTLERDMTWNVSPYAQFFDENSEYFQRIPLEDEITGQVYGWVGDTEANKRIIETVERWANDEVQFRYKPDKKPGILWHGEYLKKLGLNTDNIAARICGHGYDPDRPDLFENGIRIDIIDIDPQGRMLLDFNVDGPIANLLPKYAEPNDEEIASQLLDEVVPFEMKVEDL